MVEKAKTREEKLYYLGQQLENIRGTFYRQAMFAEFELATHDKAEAGEGLSGETFTAMYLDLLKRYHGPKVAIDPVYAVEWARSEERSVGKGCVRTGRSRWST